MQADRSGGKDKTFVVKGIGFATGQKKSRDPDKAKTGNCDQHFHDYKAYQNLK
jgi:hypothetical protein